MKEGWKMVKLGKVVKPSENYVTVSPTDSYKLLGMSLEGRGLFVREEKLGSEVSAKYLNKVVPGEFMYSRLFAWKGAFDKVSKEFEGCFVSDEYPAFQPNKDELDIDFLTYFFLQKSVWTAVEQFCIGVTKASRNRFKENFFLDFEIPLPPLAEQRRIAERLAALKGKIDEVRRLRGEQVREVERIEQRHLQMLFAQLLQEHENKSVGEILSLSSGNGITSSEISQNEGQYAVYGGGGFIGRISKYFIENETIAIGRVGARCGCVFKTEPKSWVSDNALYVTNLKEKIDHDYLVFVLETLNIRQTANQAAQPVVSQKKIYPLIIPFPKIETQSHIVAEIQAFQTKMEQLKAAQVEQLAGLEGLFPAVLERAFRGEW